MRHTEVVRREHAYTVNSKSAADNDRDNDPDCENEVLGQMLWGPPWCNEDESRLYGDCLERRLMVLDLISTQ